MSAVIAVSNDMNVTENSTPEECRRERHRIAERNRRRRLRGPGPEKVCPLCETTDADRFSASALADPRRVRLCEQCTAIPDSKKYPREPGRDDYMTAYQRNWNLKRRYGITAGEYDRMLAAQGGVCAICEQPPPSDGSPITEYLRVDHDHASGAVRALLCHSCNCALGYGRDDPALLERAAKYLRRFGR